MPRQTIPSRPPVAERVPKSIQYHDDCFVDDYFWLREKSDPKVAAYLEAENAFADALMADTAPLQERLYNEILSHIQQTDVNVPYRKGDYLYYSRTEEGKQYPLMCRRRPEEGAPEEVVLDLNELAKGEQFMALGAYAVSDDGRMLAFSTDNTGFRQYTLQVKDMITGAMLPDRVEKSVGAAWAADNRTLFYTVEDHTKRPYRLYRHRLGTPVEADGLIYEETDQRFGVSVGRTRSRAFLMLTVASHTTSEVRYLPADVPEGDWSLIAPRIQDQEYYADHRGDRFFIRTNDTGRNFRLVTAPVRSAGREHWRQRIRHRDDVMLEDVELFANHMALVERARGLTRFRIFDLRTGRVRIVAFPEPTYSAAPEHNAEWEATKFRYSYQSLVTPRSVFDFDMQSGESKLLKQTEVPGGFDRENYRSERIFARAKDGVRVPISLVYRKGLKRDGTAPIFLRAYGSYGIPYPAAFSASMLPLLDRGVVVAIAHIRGGGDLGKPWHDAGRMAKKMNTFTDFIAAAEHLIARKYGSKNRLVISGGSAGGLLMGAVANLRPDLFRAVLSYVPFVDVINTMMDDTLPLTVGEYEEWGNPTRPDEYAVMKAYCPYTNLAAKSYPAMLIRTSFNDSQVMYWEPAKYTARLRTIKTDNAPLLLKTNMAAGHGGASGRYDAYRDTAFDYAFLLRQVGIAE
ncbi:MAG TPA: S9 family peptidase [Chthonomonadaceae bacterium]|nr:S9 family peptidase [Chthonomonadaceae bacterium]